MIVTSEERTERRGKKIWRGGEESEGVSSIIRVLHLL